MVIINAEPWTPRAAKPAATSQSCPTKAKDSSFSQVVLKSRPTKAKDSSFSQVVPKPTKDPLAAARPPKPRRDAYWDLEEQSDEPKRETQLFALHDLANDYFHTFAEENRPRICRLIWAVIITSVLVISLFLIYTLIADYRRFNSFNRHVHFSSIILISGPYVFSGL